MTLPVTIPNQFANATSSIPLSQLDSNFNTLANTINEINAGTQQLSNANVATLIVTGNATIGDASSDTVTLNSTLTANTAVIFTAGTSAAPSITTTGDTNTGIFFPAADTIAFAEGGAEAMRIDSSGNVGIGTDTPTQKVDVVIPTTGTSAIFRSAGNSSALSIDHDTNIATIKTGSSDVLAFAPAGTERMRITSDGEVLVGGTTSINAAAGHLTLQGSTDRVLGLFRDDTSISSGNILGTVAFYGNDTTSNTPTALAYMRAEASGTHAAGDNPTDLVFGCTNDGSETVAEFARLAQEGTTARSFTVTQPTLVDGADASVRAVGGTAGTVNRQTIIGVYKHSGITNACGYLFFDAEDNGNNYLWADNSDVLRISTVSTNIGTTGGTVVGTQTSDERLKDISGPVAYGLNEVLAIEPIAFTMKDDPNIAKIGFSAQQVQPIVPEAVYDTKECIDGYTENEETKEQVPNSDRTKLAMEYTQLIPVLVNAVKELSAKNDALEARLSALEAK